MPATGANRSRAFSDLNREEEGLAPARVLPADAFRAALKMFIDGPRLEMESLAAELGISKATLYRWTSHREQLLTEVLTYLAERAVKIGLEAGDGLEGVARVEAFTRGFVDSVVVFEPFRRFVRAETPLAFRLLTTRGGLVQSTISSRIAAMLEEEVNKGTLELPVSTDDLAYAMIRVIEAFVYNDAMADIDTDVESAVQIVCLMVD